jgi:hypothetical protein
MNLKKIGRERVMWMAAVAALMSSLAWLAVINVALIFAADHRRLADVLLVMKAIVRVALALVGGTWPLLFAALLATGLVAVALRDRAVDSFGEGVRHV